MHIAIVEDDEKYIAQLWAFLERFSKESKNTISTEVYHNGAEFIGNYKPIYDAIFLDVEMPVMNGIKTAEAIREMDKAVIIMFITNLAQYAVKGFEVEAIDYVLKPIEYPSFTIKMNKILRELRIKSYASLLINTSDGETLRLPLQQITYIEVIGHYLHYHTIDSIYKERSDRTMKLLTKELAENGFSRCNNAYLVNLFYVDRLDKEFCFVNGEKLAISRTKRKQFIEDSKKYMEGRFFS